MKRGFVPEDAKEFNEKSLLLLKKAGEELLWLIDRGYPIKSVSTFVGNHYLLSERQRVALMRSISPTASLKQREEKRISDCKGKTVFIDGFNQIITLEVALSNSTLLKCMDKTIRDLAGLRGTYRLIDKTEQAIELIAQQLQHLEIASVVFYLDKPVSNSGRLKMKILELLKKYDFDVTVELADNADVILEKLDFVITSDAIILDKCKSWINLLYDIIENMPEKKYISIL